MGNFEIATSLVGEQLLPLANLLRNTAYRNPRDGKAQLQAQAATGFFESQVRFPALMPAEELAPSSDAPPDDRSNRQSTGLPVEIYQLIIQNVMNFDHESRQETLVALSCSSKTLRAVAEPSLYKHPCDLDPVQRQWHFLFTLTVEPRLSSLVQSLRLLWLSTEENSELLIRIARACPNITKLLVQRGESEFDYNQISEQDIHNMASLLDACRRLRCLRYTTFVEWTPEIERYRDIMGGKAFERSIGDPRWAEAGRRLIELSLDGRVQWLLHALMPNLSIGLTTIELDWDIDLASSPNIFTNLAHTSPLLQTLKVSCPISNSEDLEAACRVWGPTLRVLTVQTMDQDSDQIARTVPFMQVLEELSLGSGCVISLRDMDAIARSCPPQRFSHLSLRELLVPEQGGEKNKAPDELNDSLIRLIESHSSTLRRISLNNGYLKVGRAVLHCLKKATRLEALHVGAPSDAQSSDIDHLLEACPVLECLEPSLAKISARRDEWAGRREALDEREEKEADRDQSAYELGR